nr:AT-rich interactive domain-containing protein 4B-like [Anolis sagrei ordinatus]
MEPSAKKDCTEVVQKGEQIERQCLFVMLNTVPNDYLEPIKIDGNLLQGWRDMGSEVCVIHTKMVPESVVPQKHDEHPDGASDENVEIVVPAEQVMDFGEKGELKESLTLEDVLPSAASKEIDSAEFIDKDNEIQSEEKAEEKLILKESIYLAVDMVGSTKYQKVFCEEKIHTSERLVEVKITSRHDSFTMEVPDDGTKEVLKIRTVIEVKNLSETYRKEERQFAENKTLDQLLLTNPEHFDMSTTEEKISRERRSNHISEEEEDKNQADGLLRKVIYTDYVSLDKKTNLQFQGLKVHPDSSDETTIEKDNVLVCSSNDGGFSSIPRKDVQRTINSSIRPDATLKQAFIRALKLNESRTVPDNWKIRLKEEAPATKKRENFLQQRGNFVEDQEILDCKQPVMDYRDLNLFKLFRLPHDFEGLNDIIGLIYIQILRMYVSRVTGKFIPSFSTLAVPLTNLTRKSCPNQNQ